MGIKTDEHWAVIPLASLEEVDLFETNGMKGPELEFGLIRPYFGSDWRNRAWNMTIVEFLAELYAIKCRQYRLPDQDHGWYETEIWNKLDQGRSKWNHLQLKTDTRTGKMETNEERKARIDEHEVTRRRDSRRRAVSAL